MKSALNIGKNRNSLNPITLWVKSKISIEAILIFCSIAIGAFLRIYKIGKDSLWLDEIDAVTTSALPIRKMLSALTWHASPPLDYVILHFIQRLGRDEIIIRLPAALAGVVSIYLIYQVGKLLFNARTGVSSAIMLSFSMAAIAYSQEARMYSLFMMLTCAMTLCCYFVIKNPISWKGWIASSLVGLLLLYTHYFSILLLFALGLLFLVACFYPHWNSRIFARGLVSFAFLGIFFTAWIPELLIQSSHRSGILTYALNHQDYWQSIIGFLSNGVAVNFQIIYAVLFFIGILYSLWKSPIKAGLLTAFTVIPLVLAYIVPQISLIVTPRNMLFVLPGVILGISYGLTELIQQILLLTHRYTSKYIYLSTILTVTFTVLISIIPSRQMLLNYYDTGWWMKGPRADLRQAAAQIKKSNPKGTIVLTNDRYTQYLLTYYLDPKAILNMTLSDFIHEPPHLLASAPSKIAALSLEATPLQARSAISTAKDVWEVFPDEEKLKEIGLYPDQIYSPVLPSNVPLFHIKKPALLEFVKASPADSNYAFKTGWSTRVHEIQSKQIRWMSTEGLLSLPIWSIQNNKLFLEFFTPQQLIGSQLIVRILESGTFPITLNSGWQSVELTIPKELLQGKDWLNIQLSVEAPQNQPVAYTIGKTGILSPISIIAESSGLVGLSYGDIYLNGQLYSWNDAGKGFGKGYNLVAINPKDGSVIGWDVFDTDGDPTESDRMLSFVNDLPNGAIVAGVVKDDGAANLTDTGVRALQILGSQIDIRRHFRAAHAFIGVKGAEPGSALETGLSLTNAVAIGEDKRNYKLALAKAEILDEYSSPDYKPIMKDLPSDILINGKIQNDYSSPITAMDGTGWYDFDTGINGRWAESPAEIVIYSRIFQTVTLELYPVMLFVPTGKDGLGDSGIMTINLEGKDLTQTQVKIGQPTSVEISLQPGYNHLAFSLEAGNFQPNKIQAQSSDSRSLSFALAKINILTK